MTRASMMPTTQLTFESLFHRLPEAAAYAPGRVNLMGDHTDYNGGYVLPMILPHETCVELAVRQDRVMHIWSASVRPEDAYREYELGREAHTHDWLDYVQGLTAILRQNEHHLVGFDMRISSSVPLGAGVSSSASLLVAVLRGIRTAMHLELSDIAIAHLAHQAETEFVRAPVGMMDQMVCALGHPGSAFFLDTATSEYEHVPIPPSIEWIVIHSGVRHSHVTGSYQQRRRECEEACALLGLRSMRELEGAGRQEVLARIDDLAAPLNRRARHVVMENERVLTAVELLKRGHVSEFGAVMDKSHASLKHDYAVSVQETDLLVDLAHEEPGVYGARLTGGGFGGSVVIGVQAGMEQDISTRIMTKYRSNCGEAGTVLLPQPASYSGRS
jgi:galactokinase